MQSYFGVYINLWNVVLIENLFSIVFYWVDAYAGDNCLQPAVDTTKRKE